MNIEKEIDRQAKLTALGERLTARYEARSMLANVMNALISSGACKSTELLVETFKQEDKITKELENEINKLLEEK